MTGTGPEPPQDPATSDDHAYFQSIEEAFLRLRGKSTLLSAADWQVAQGWHRAGVPVDVVVQVMETLFARARERRRRTISSLSYFKAAVESAWEEVAALSAGGRRERLEPIRVEERLRRLAASLGADLPDGERWRRSIAELRGELPEVENELAEIDRRLLLELARGLSDSEREAHLAAVARALEPLRSRLPPDELETAGAHLRARLLRQKFRLPVLSLFAPEAREPEVDSAS